MIICELQFDIFQTIFACNLSIGYVYILREYKDFECNYYSEIYTHKLCSSGGNYFLQREQLFSPAILTMSQLLLLAGRSNILGNTIGQGCKIIYSEVTRDIFNPF
jgi:hypothetical protein